MDNKTTDYLLRKVDSGVWNRFQAICRSKGESARSILVKLIVRYINRKDNRTL